jgi:tetratricopeptide (TPR) repeat protein
VVPADAPLSPELAIPLRRAREALADEQLPRAIELASQVLAGETDADEPPTPPPPRAAHAALEILAWAHLLGGHLEQATDALDGAGKIAPPDGALVAALLMAKGMKKEARRVLEAARTAGDERKEIVGPLIQLLLEAGEVPRAAAVALDIVDSLSEDDARQMAAITFERGAFEWSARLSEKMFERTRAPEDAYEAARALAKDSQNDRALELLRKAVDAGFTDRARAWSDAALEALRAEPALEAVLPRP